MDFRESLTQTKLCIHVSVHNIKTVAWFISQMCEVLLKLAELPEVRNTTHVFMFYSFLKYLADNTKS